MCHLYSITKILQEPNNDNSCVFSSLQLSYLLLSTDLNSFQKIGVIGVYSISIAAVILTLVATVVTTTEEPGKEVVEPFGKF